MRVAEQRDLMHSSRSGRPFSRSTAQPMVASAPARGGDTGAPFARARRFLIAPLMAALLHGCGDAGPRTAADPEDQSAPVFRAAEVEPGPPAADAGLAEHARIGAEDVGNTIVAQGAVVGEPLQDGFFFRTEDESVVFVHSSRRVTSGDLLRVVGPLRPFPLAQAQAAAARAFPGGVPQAWSLQTQVFVHATSVSEN